MNNHFIRAWVTLVFSLAVLSVICSQRAHAQNAEQPTIDNFDEWTAAYERKSLGLPPESEPAYSLEQAEAWRDEVLPVVEKIAEREFTHVPELKIVRQAEVSASYRRDVRLQVRALMPAASKLQIENAVERATLKKGPLLLAKYGIADKIVLLPAGNILPLLEKFEIDPALMPGIMKIVLAHELTHALHDQHADLERQLQRLNTSEQALVLRTLIEGFGIFVHKHVAGELELDREAEALERLLLFAWHPEKGAAAPSKIGELIYKPGKRFITTKHERDGAEGVWQLLQHPPEEYKSLRNMDKTKDSEPATSEQSEQPIDFEKVLSIVAERFEEDDWQIVPMGGGPEFARKVVAKLPKQTQDDFVSRLRAMQSLMLQSRNRNARPMPGRCGFSIYHLKSPDDAPAVLATLQQVVRSFRNESGPMAHDHEQPFDFANLPFDATHDWSFQIDDGKGTSAEVRFLYGWTDDIIVQYMSMMVDMDDETIRAMFRDVLQQYRALRVPHRAESQSEPAPES